MMVENMVLGDDVYTVENEKESVLGRNSKKRWRTFRANVVAIRRQKTATSSLGMHHSKLF